MRQNGHDPGPLASRTTLGSNIKLREWRLREARPSRRHAWRQYFPHFAYRSDPNVTRIRGRCRRCATCICFGPWKKAGTSGTRPPIPTEELHIGRKTTIDLTRQLQAAIGELRSVANSKLFVA